MFSPCLLTVNRVQTALSSLKSWLEAWPFFFKFYQNKYFCKISVTLRMQHGRILKYFEAVFPVLIFIVVTSLNDLSSPEGGLLRNLLHNPVFKIHITSLKKTCPGLCPDCQKTIIFLFVCLFLHFNFKGLLRGLSNSSPQKCNTKNQWKHI